MYVIQRLSTPIFTTTVTVPNAAGIRLSDLIAQTAGDPPWENFPTQMQAIVLANLDSSILIYLDVNNSNISATSFEEILDPTDSTRTFKRLADSANADCIWVRAASGAPKMKVNIYA